MTKEEWRSLQPNDLVTTSCSSGIFKVISTGWEDMEEEDYQSDDDYIIEVKNLFDCYDKVFIVRAHQTNFLNINIPTEVIEAAQNSDAPYIFLDGYFMGKNNLQEVELKLVNNVQGK